MRQHHRKTYPNLYDLLILIGKKCVSKLISFGQIWKFSLVAIWKKVIMMKGRVNEEWVMYLRLLINNVSIKFVKYSRDLLS